MIIWEYKIINDWEHGSPETVFELNELGKDGWELICCKKSPFVIGGPVGVGHSWYFKRPVNHQSSTDKDKHD